MKRSRITNFLILCVLLIMTASMIVQADDDHEQARHLKESGQILPLEKIIKAAQAEHAGRVIEVELESDDGRHVYEVELLDQQGEVWELYFDATNGELIKSKRDD